LLSLEKNKYEYREQAFIRSSCIKNKATSLQYYKAYVNKLGNFKKISNKEALLKENLFVNNFSFLRRLNTLTGENELIHFTDKNP
jgi:hypothetical protein